MAQPALPHWHGCKAASGVTDRPVCGTGQLQGSRDTGLRAAERPLPALTLIFSPWMSCSTLGFISFSSEEQSREKLSVGDRRPPLPQRAD